LIAVQQLVKPYPVRPGAGVLVDPADRFGIDAAIDRVVLAPAVEMVADTLDDPAGHADAAVDGSVEDFGGDALGFEFGEMQRVPEVAFVQFSSASEGQVADILKGVGVSGDAVFRAAVTAHADFATGPVAGIIAVALQAAFVAENHGEGFLDVGGECRGGKGEGK